MSGMTPSAEAVQFLEGVLPTNDSLQELEIYATASYHRDLTSNVRARRKKVYRLDQLDKKAGMFTGLPHSVATWLEKWTAAAEAVPVSDIAGPSGMKKRKRMTEAERLRAALQ